MMGATGDMAGGATGGARVGGSVTGTDFAATTAVRPAGDGAYLAELAPEFGIEGNMNGGYLLAILARAGMAATGHPFPHTVAASFFRPAAAGPARVEVTVQRAGRTATYLRAVLIQGGEAAVDAQLVLGAAPADSPGAPAPFPLPPAREQCVPASKRSASQGLLHVVSVDYTPGLGPDDPVADGEPATIRGWVDLLSPSPPDPLVALFVSDILPPSVFRFGLRRWAPTVHLTALLNRVPAPGPLAAQSVAGEVRDGWFDEDTAVADSSGLLVAQVRQLARMPRGRVTR